MREFSLFILLLTSECLCKDHRANAKASTAVIIVRKIRILSALKNEVRLGAVGELYRVTGD
jgi:hypothetical protein